MAARPRAVPDTAGVIACRLGLRDAMRDMAGHYKTCGQCHGADGHLARFCSTGRELWKVWEDWQTALRDEYKRPPPAEDEGRLF